MNRQAAFMNGYPYLQEPPYYGPGTYRVTPFQGYNRRGRYLNHAFSFRLPVKSNRRPAAILNRLSFNSQLSHDAACHNQQGTVFSNFSGSNLHHSYEQTNFTFGLNRRVDQCSYNRTKFPNGTYINGNNLTQQANLHKDDDNLILMSSTADESEIQKSDNTNGSSKISVETQTTESEFKIDAKKISVETQTDEVEADNDIVLINSETQTDCMSESEDGIKPWSDIIGCHDVSCSKEGPHQDVLIPAPFKQKIVEHKEDLYNGTSGCDALHSKDFPLTRTTKGESEKDHNKYFKPCSEDIEKYEAESLEKLLESFDRLSMPMESDKHSSSNLFLETIPGGSSLVSQPVSARNMYANEMRSLETRPSSCASQEVPYFTRETLEYPETDQRNVYVFGDSNLDNELLESMTSYETFFKGDNSQVISTHGFGQGSCKDESSTCLSDVNDCNRTDLSRDFSTHGFGQGSCKDESLTCLSDVNDCNRMDLSLDFSNEAVSNCLSVILTKKKSVSTMPLLGIQHSSLKAKGLPPPLNFGRKRQLNHVDALHFDSSDKSNLDIKNVSESFTNDPSHTTNISGSTVLKSFPNDFYVENKARVTSVPTISNGDLNETNKPDFTMCTSLPFDDRGGPAMPHCLDQTASDRVANISMPNADVSNTVNSSKSKFALPLSNLTPTPFVNSSKNKFALPLPNLTPTPYVNSSKNKFALPLPILAPIPYVNSSKNKFALPLPNLTPTLYVNYAVGRQNPSTTNDPCNSQAYNHSGGPVSKTFTHPETFAMLSNDYVPLKEPVRKREKIYSQKHVGKAPQSLRTSSKQRKPLKCFIDKQRRKELELLDPTDWQVVSNPKRIRVHETNVKRETFFSQEKYDVLIKCIREKYPFLNNDEAKSVLETILDETNYLNGLRRSQILLGADIVVESMFPSMHHAETVTNRPECDNAAKERGKQEDLTEDAAECTDEKVWSNFISTNMYAQLDLNDEFHKGLRQN